MRPKYSKLLTKIGWLVIPIFILVSPILSSVDGLLIYLPFALSVIFLGIPHGAVDHLVPRYISDDYTTKQSVYLVVLLYGITGIAYAASWFVLPSVSLALFIFLTVLHWGQGDTYVMSKVFSASYLENRNISILLSVLIRGSLPMILPYIFYKDRYLEIIREIVSIFSEGLGVFSLLQSDVSVYVATALLLAMFLVYLFVALNSRSDLRTILLDTSEILILVVFFYSLPPVISIGIYFCFWHSCRHIGRLLDSDDVLQEYDVLRGLERFIKISTPMTIGGIFLIGIIWVLVGQPTEINDQLLGVYLVGIAVMTLPHFIIVTWMDLKQSIYQ